MKRRESMTIKQEVIDELLKEYKTPEDLVGKDGIFKQLQKALIERAMAAEMTHHLGYEKNDPKGYNSGNSRNGKGKKTIKGDFGELEIEVPRDRNSEFDPQLIKKRQTRFKGFDDKIISMYARGMTTRDIRDHLLELYDVEVSSDLISSVTDGIIDEVNEWRNRELDPLYPILYLDAIVVKVRDEGHIRNKSVYLALAVNMEGHKELLGIWIETTEGAKFWLRVVTELNNRGVKDIFIACVDGLKGFEDAIHSVFPGTEVQLCIVHMVRNSLKFVSYKDRKKVATDLKRIYHSVTVDDAQSELDNFRETWDQKYPLIGKSWQNHWNGVTPFLAYPDYIRKAIYTTNAIESISMSLRKALKTRRSFPNDEAALKLIYLATRNTSKKWTMPIRNWELALNQFAIIFEERLTRYDSFTQLD
ncbi:MAG: IS256 family transposase [Methanomassiliicoccales archaeon]|nr:MAG: IS256 family transposase [Methanomassiliicoccales archaeon]